MLVCKIDYGGSLGAAIPIKLVSVGEQARAYS